MGKQSFEAVVAEHGTAVLRVCRAVAGPDDADDAWPETFLSALKAYPALPAGATVGGSTDAARRAAADDLAALRRTYRTRENAND